MASSRSSAPRLRRRPRNDVWRIAWRQRACQIGFIAGFIAGTAIVASLSRSHGAVITDAVAATSSTTPSR